MCNRTEELSKWVAGGWGQCLTVGVGGTDEQGEEARAIHVVMHQIWDLCMDAAGSTWKYVQTCVGCSVSCTERATASEASNTLSAQIWDSNTIGNKSKQCSLEKKLFLEPEQEMQKMSMASCNARE